MKVELPYEIGAFVKVIEEEFERRNLVTGPKPLYGSVVAYTVTSETEYLIWVSGYKEAWSGEFLQKEVIPLTEAEIEMLITERG